MIDLSRLSPAALDAAMRGGTDGWGQVASALRDVRYMEPIKGKRRRKCHCGCDQKATHKGLAKGVALMSGCELSVRRWIRNPLAPLPEKRPDLPQVLGRDTYTVRMNNARRSLSQILDRVLLKGEVIVIQRKEERVAVIPAEWLDRLREMEEKSADGASSDA